MKRGMRTYSAIKVHQRSGQVWTFPRGASAAASRLVSSQHGHRTIRATLARHAPVQGGDGYGSVAGRGFMQQRAYPRSCMDAATHPLYRRWAGGPTRAKSKGVWHV
jgi:hypothetical protein